MAIKYVYKTKEGYYLNVESVKKLNGGKPLSKSQEALLSLKKVNAKKEASQ